MTNRFVIPLLCAASVVAFARGNSGHNLKTSASTSSRSAKTLLTSKFTVNAGRKVEFNLDVRNNSQRMVELRFRDGKTHDFYVKDASGNEVWRWSKSRMFTQGVQNKLVKARDVAVFSEQWTPSNAHGRYTAVAVLPSANHPIEEQLEFELK